MHSRTKVLIAAGTFAAGAVIGLASIPPARAAFDAVMSCAQTSPCLEWDNSKSGDALKGVSSKGNAVHGQTKFKSAGQSAGRSGVLGEDLSTSGDLNAGVSGFSTNGAGVIGTSSTYNAVEGLSTNSTGVYGQTGAAPGFGAAGRNTASTHDNNGAGVLADGGPANDGLHAFANGTNATGVYAFSQTGTALFANQGSGAKAPELYLQDTQGVNDFVKATGPSGDVLELNSSAMTLNANLIVSAPEGVSIGGAGFGFVPLSVDGNGDSDLLYLNSGTANEMSVSGSGDVSIAGLLYSQGSCHFGCLVGQKRVRAVTEYNPVETEPTIEDTGEATLVNGRADVALDPKFANVVDASSPYIVTITPEGDSRGLFVANRSASGFTVRESQGGHSSIAFAFRIVAKRFGVDAPRLPMTTIKQTNPPARGNSRHH